mmetsp:Transcript_33991/g.100949  ORF Transcript_33991/g.100949 Transcript_33991/m.100949 type:complete len:905 (-) Transcript_33991:143-2857(-)
MKHAMLCVLLLAGLVNLARSKSWYDGIEGIKVFKPTDAVQNQTDAIYWWKQSRDSQFNRSRYALLFTRGTYNMSMQIMVGYYTSIIGVGKGPDEVRLPNVMSVNGKVGGATQNFWRSVEGVTLTGSPVSAVWAVSQAAPMRRTIIEGNLYLSDNGGWSSGGFIADVRVKGSIGMGTQQQWFFRNVDVGEGGVKCPVGWNYVFMGVTGMEASTCEGDQKGKVTVVEETPRVAEKPYVVQEDDAAGTWRIYVPEQITGGARGATKDHVAGAARRLDIDSEVFVAREGDSAATINEGIRDKKGLLLTPGVYELDATITIAQDGFVVLGLGFPTLIAKTSARALHIDGKAQDVRVAGILVEAGAPVEDGAQVLFSVGSRGETGELSPFAGTGSRIPIVLSDVFARIGSFQYQGCPVVGAHTMLELNADDIVLDNSWLWQADHDDCNLASDQCTSTHALVVNGRRTMAYGLAAEHVTNGDIVRWNGEEGKTFFYQCELPYHTASFGQAGYQAYRVAPNVKDHEAFGMGVYIISAENSSSKLEVNSALTGSPSTRFRNLVTVSIGGKSSQFHNMECVVGEGDDGEGQCIKASYCHGKVCYLPEPGKRYEAKEDQEAGGEFDVDVDVEQEEATTTSGAPTLPPLPSFVPVLAPSTEKEHEGDNLALSITIVSAVGLESQDWLGGRSDPYCTCEIPGKEKTLFKTGTLLNNPNPFWNHMAVVNDYNKTDALRFKVKDKDFWDDNLLGSAELLASQIWPGGFIGALSLKDKHGHHTAAMLNIRVQILHHAPAAPMIQLLSEEDTRSPVRALADGVLRRVADLGLERCVSVVAGILAVATVANLLQRRRWEPRAAEDGAGEQLLDRREVRTPEGVTELKDMAVYSFVDRTDTSEVSEPVTEDSEPTAAGVTTLT